MIPNSKPHAARTARAALVCVLAAITVAGRGETCGLGLHRRITLNSPQRVPCCGGSLYQDVDLTAPNIQIDLANVQFTGQAPVDGFMTTTSCQKLFDGEYPGASPLCTVYLGPVPPGSVSQRVTLPSGTYRVFAQAHSSNTTDASWRLDVGIWDHRCVGPIGSSQ